LTRTNTGLLQKFVNYAGKSLDWFYNIDTSWW